MNPSLKRYNPVDTACLLLGPPPRSTADLIHCGSLSYTLGLDLKSQTRSVEVQVKHFFSIIYCEGPCNWLVTCPGCTRASRPVTAGICSCRPSSQRNEWIYCEVVQKRYSPYETTFFFFFFRTFASFSRFWDDALFFSLRIQSLMYSSSEGVLSSGPPYDLILNKLLFA